MKHTTIIDIAKKLGISASTVSRALSNHPDIKASTKNQIKKLARELKYNPNPMAQSLKNNKTTMIGVIVPVIKHDFFAYAISGIEEVAYHSGYTIIVCQSNESHEIEVVNTNALIRQRVAGIIASISQSTNNSEHFRAVIDHGIPLVFFDREIKDINTSKVIIDDAKSARMAVNHLIDRGYKSIAHFAGPKSLTICELRLKGYTEALKNAHIPLNDDLILFGGMDESDGYRTMDALIKKKITIDAIFAVNDPVAIGAYQRIKEAGLKIPDQIGIVGFSNNKITNLVEPGLTTVDQPSYEMGKIAAEVLIKLIGNGNKSLKSKKIILETKLIIRGST